MSKHTAAARLKESLRAHVRTIPIKEPNRVKTVTKLGNGDLRVEQNSGNVFIVSKDDELFQQFVIYSILAEL